MSSKYFLIFCISLFSIHILSLTLQLHFDLILIPKSNFWSKFSAKLNQISFSFTYQSCPISSHPRLLYVWNKRLKLDLKSPHPNLAGNKSGLVSKNKHQRIVSNARNVVTEVHIFMLCWTTNTLYLVLLTDIVCSGLFGQHIRISRLG